MRFAIAPTNSIRITPYSLVIFDIDGTLADSFPCFLCNVNGVAGKFSFRPPEWAQILQAPVIPGGTEVWHYCLSFGQKGTLLWRKACKSGRGMFFLGPQLQGINNEKTTSCRRGSPFADDRGLGR
jgi:phosphoglycolate phosphatase-like HAD superfamily hydrolase